MVRDFRVDLILAVISALDDSNVGSIVGSTAGSIVDSIVGSIVGPIMGLIVGLIVGSIVGSAISTLGSELCLVLFLTFSVVDDRSAVVGTVIYMPLISFRARVQEDAEVMDHLPCRNIVACPPKSNLLIHRREN